MEHDLFSIQNKRHSVKNIVPVSSPSTKEDSSTVYEIKLAKMETELAMIKSQLTATEAKLKESECGRARYRNLWIRTVQELGRAKQQLDLEKSRFVSLKSHGQWDQMKPLRVHTTEQIKPDVENRHLAYDESERLVLYIILLSSV